MELTTTFEQVAVGARWISPGRTLSEADLLQSCMTSGDWHPIHADESHAAKTPLGRRIFQGSYGLHVAFGMATAFPPLGDTVLAALGFSQWHYLKPLFVGDTVKVEVEVLSKRVTSNSERGLIERRITVRNQKDDIVQQGVAQTLVRIDGNAHHVKEST